VKILDPTLFMMGIGKRDSTSNTTEVKILDPTLFMMGIGKRASIGVVPS